MLEGKGRHVKLAKVVEVHRDLMDLQAFRHHVTTT